MTHDSECKTVRSKRFYWGVKLLIGGAILCMAPLGVYVAIDREPTETVFKAPGRQLLELAAGDDLMLLYESRSDLEDEAAAESQTPDSAVVTVSELATRAPVAPESAYSPDEIDDATGMHVLATFWVDEPGEYMIRVKGLSAQVHAMVGEGTRRRLLWGKVIPIAVVGGLIQLIGALLFVSARQAGPRKATPPAGASS